jgi:hypothetical protein
MPSQSWVALVPSLPAADGTALANSVTLTAISPLPDVTIPANFLAVGSRIRISATGRYSTTATPTLNLGIYYGGVGGVAAGVTGAITMPSTVTNLTWALEAYITIRTAGSAGTGMCTGKVQYGNAATTALAIMLPSSAPATFVADTTTAKTLVLGATWGTASASNTITVHDWLVESLA